MRSQISQTASAPSIAPLLLPLPPTISITQMRNVPNIGTKVSGVIALT